MKEFIISLLLIGNFLLCDAQSVLIGTGSPNTKAMLEARSTSKGVLIPRMTTTQRLALASTPAGLLVYDTNRDEVYGYDGTAWRYILDNSFWKMNGTDVYNLTDSIGIGTSSPDEKLHVNGNVTTNNGDVLFVESSGTGTKLISDYNGINVNGYNHSIGFYDNAFRRGYIQYRKYDATDEHRFDFGVGAVLFSMQTNGVSYFNATDGTLQFQTGGVDKGFVQLAGNDFRIGTNSSNTAGRFVIRNNNVDRFFVDASGRVGIGGPANPGNSLEVLGSVKASANLRTSNSLTALNAEISTEINKPSTSGNANLVPVFYGAVAQNGTCSCSAPSITVTNPYNGNYVISYPGMSSNDIIMVKGNEWNERASATYGGLGPNHPGFLIITRNNNYAGANVSNSDFSFIIFKQ